MELRENVPTAQEPQPAPTAPTRPPGDAASRLDDLGAKPAGPPLPPSDALGGEPCLDAAVEYYRRRRGALPRSKDDLIGLISHDVAEVDERLGRQVNAILHHPRFQQLEAVWRGLEHLVAAAAEGEDVKVKVLQLAKRELEDDLHGALEFDQSYFFHKVYEEEYGTAGGEPFGVLIADYQFRNTPSDVDLLGRVAGVAAAAFAPFIAGAHPELLGIPRFDLLERIHDLSAQFEGLRHLKWRSLRDEEDSRYVGLTLPRTLMRLPYDDAALREDGFVFHEDVTAPDRSGYLWGNAAFAFGGVLIRAFLRSAWFADIRGTSRGPGTGGVVTGLPAQSFSTDRPGVAVKCCVETMISEDHEKELGDLGFIPLCDCEDTEYSAFYSTQSLQRPKTYDDETASINARMSAMLQYILCASRFAHYLKVIARDQVGGVSDAKRFQSQLHSWIHQFVAKNPGASPAERARFPLREAQVEVAPHPAEPGHLRATLMLQPHLQLDELTASVKLVTRLQGK
jgi:type VI secretion system ImpC/EvpB family protein